MLVLLSAIFIIFVSIWTFFFTVVPFVYKVVDRYGDAASRTRFVQYFKTCLFG